LTNSAMWLNNNPSGTFFLWEGRHKSSFVQSERYFLTCSRYIELNPVVANMVSKPEQYKWSSYMCNAWDGEGIVEQHIEYLKLGEEPESRRHAYRELFRYTISSEDIHIIEDAARYNRPLGDSRFSEQIASQYGVVIPRATRGRPRLDGK